MEHIHNVIAQKFRAHSFLAEEDMVAIRTLRGHTRDMRPEEDIVRQGDLPQFAIVVLSGMVARYHLLRNGQRQYLSFHIAGDMPDAQALLLHDMDHAVCAIDRAEIGLIPHKELLTLFTLRPQLALAVWRETLIDAAIFRQAITNNGSRSGPARLAHFFCEQYCRAETVGLVRDKACPLPLSQAQIGQALGMSLVTANRALQKLRATGAADLRGGKLRMHDFRQLARLGQFDPAYLHLKS